MSYLDTTYCATNKMLRFVIVTMLWLCCIGQMSAQISAQFEDEVDIDRLSEVQSLEDALPNATTEDSVILYTELAGKSLSINQELSQAYLDAGQSIFQHYQNDSLYYLLQSLQAKKLVNAAKLDSAYAILQSCLAYFDKEKDKAAQGKIYQYIGDLHYRRGEMDESLRSMLTAKSLLEEVGASTGGVLTWLGILYNNLHDYESAIENLQPFVDDFRFGIHKEEVAYVLMANLSFAYMAMDSFQLADDYFINALPYYDKVDNPRTWYQYYGQGYNIAIAKEDYNAANEYAEKMIAYATLLGTDGYLATAYQSKYFAVKECCPDEDRLSYLAEARKYAVTDGAPEKLKGVYEYLSEEAIERKDFEEAIYYKEKVDSIASVLFTKDMATEIKKIEKQRLKEISDKEIALLQEQSLLKEENIAKQKKIKYGLIAFLICLLVGLLIITKLLRRRTEDAAQLEEKNVTITKALDTNKMLIKEVHHRVKNNLQVVSSLLSLQSRYIDDDLAKEALSTGRSRVQSMSLLHQSLYQKDNVKQVDLQSYFENLTQNLFSTYRTTDQDISLVTHIDALELDVDTVIPMGLITNELVSNALKYAFVGREKGTITVDLHDTGEQIILQVADDGIGVSFTEIPAKTTSLGLKLIQSFAEKLEAEVVIKNEGGSTFTVVIDKANLDTATV